MDNNNSKKVQLTVDDMKLLSQFLFNVTALYQREKPNSAQEFLGLVTLAMFELACEGKSVNDD